MSTLSDKLSYLVQTKDEIKQAIEGKNVTVPEGATFRNYVGLIESISGASEPVLQEKTVIPTADQQVITPDKGFDGLSAVIVEGDENLAPEDMIYLSENNVLNVSSHESGILWSPATVVKMS